MMWAVLGDIEFELVNHPSQQSERTTADYAEHARMQGKPLLEWIGDGLDELTLELALHAALVDPEEQIRTLKAAKSAHQPLPYVLGSGDYRGVYLITALDVTTRKTTAEGRLLSALVTLTLREYSGPYRRPRPKPPGLRSDLLALPATRVGGAAAPLGTLTQKALGLARQAGNVLRAGVEAFEMAKGLRDNPLALLGQSPRLLGLAGQALAPLQGLQGAATGLLASGADLLSMGANVAGDVRQALATVQGLRDDPLALLGQAPQLLGRIGQGLPLDGLQNSAAGLLASGSELLRLGVDAAGDVQQAVVALDPLALDSVVGKVDYAAGRMQQAMTRLDASAPRLARMAADVITRRA